MAAPALNIVDARVPCAVAGCGHKSHSLLDHIKEAHGLSVADYCGKHPGAATVSQALIDGVKAKRKGTRRTAAPAVTSLTLDMMGETVRVNHQIAEGQCLPLPEGYAFPRKGKAKAALLEVVECLSDGDSVFFWGPAGTGKDAVMSAYSAMTRTPGLIYTFTSGTDVKRWFYSREIDSEGTAWSYGTLWNALVHGITGRDGKQYPALIVFSDVDRGTADQLEEFRLMLDTTSKRLVGPTGEVHTILPGTRFAFTANSCGSGDDTGRMSSRAMDASLLDRMGAFVEAHYMDWSDEADILRSKFPEVAAAAPLLFDELGQAVSNIRKAIDGTHDSYEIEGDLTHRGICEILRACTRKHRRGTPVDRLLKTGFRVWLARLDRDNRLVAKRLIDACVTGGAFSDDE